MGPGLTKRGYGLPPIRGWGKSVVGASRLTEDTGELGREQTHEGEEGPISHLY